MRDRRSEDGHHGFDAFLESNIQPGITASGVQMQGPPDIKEFPVDEIIHP